MPPLDLHPDQCHYGQASNPSSTVDNEANPQQTKKHIVKRKWDEETIDGNDQMSAQSETTEVDIYYYCINCISVSICLSM